MPSKQLLLSIFGGTTLSTFVSFLTYLVARSRSKDDTAAALRRIAMENDALLDKQDAQRREEERQFRREQLADSESRLAMCKAECEELRKRIARLERIIRRMRGVKVRKKTTNGQR